MSNQDDRWADVFLSSDLDRRNDEAELLAWEREKVEDRLGRDNPVRTPCCVCGENPGKSIYGLMCRQCHEARREEREAA